MARPYRYFSADSHFESLPETWTHRVPAKFRGRAAARRLPAHPKPRIVRPANPPLQGEDVT